MLGRERELATALADVAAVAESGSARGRALVIEGDPGVGKTTLADEVMAHVRALGFRELRCAGIQTQTEIGFAGLHELIYPILDLADLLPGRQRAALLTAFGAVDEDAEPDRLLISLAVLGLIEEASSDRPLVLCVDDAQWLDRSTQDVLTFVGRRLGNTPALMVGITRPGPDGQSKHLLGLPRLTLETLDDDHSRALLTEVITRRGFRRLDDTAQRRLLYVAGGNPLAVIEMTTALAERDEDKWQLSEWPLPTTRRIERAFLDQLDDLGDSTRAMLLVAATGAGLDLGEVRQVAQRLDLSDSDIGALESAGLVSVDPAGIQVRHCLIRSAVYSSASLTARTAVHLAIAESCRNTARAAWHRAAACYGPDETIAAELTDAAAVATTQGAHAEAAAALRRAADLSPDHGDQIRRLTAAAEAYRKAGLSAKATRTIDRALALVPGAAERVQLEITRYVLAAMGGAPGRTVDELTSLAAEFGAIDDPAAHFGEAFMLGAAAIRWQMYGHGDQQRAQITDAIRRAQDKPSTTATVGGILEVAEAVVTGETAAGRYAEQVKALLDEFADDPLVLSAVSLAAEYTWNFEAAQAGWGVLVARSRAEGLPGHECDGLRGGAIAALQTGRLRDAVVAAENAARISEDVNLLGMAASATATLARAHVWRGERAEAAEAITRSRTLLQSDSAVVWNSHLHWAAGLSALTAGDHDEALRELSAMAAHPQLQLWAVGDLTEAAVGAGCPEAARDLVEKALAAAATSDSPYLTMLAHRSQALLSTDDDTAEARFVTAIAAGGNCTGTLELARSQLAFGQWLRRKRRIVASRAPLAAAAAAFEEAGARPWFDIAKSELRAAGMAATSGATVGRVESLLTAQEMQIAELAAQGLTNKEIADRVYLSHRTVAAHLYRVFPKLGITTRGQLIAAMRD